MMSLIGKERQLLHDRIYASNAQPWWKRSLLTVEMAIIGLLVAVVIFLMIAVPNFNNPLTLYYLLQEVTPILLMAMAMTLIILTGDIDLSVASILALASVTFGLCVKAGLPVPLCIVLAIVVGLLCGVINGFLITVVGLPALAVTIGTMAAFRGIAAGLMGTTAVTNFPADWTNLVLVQIGTSGIPWYMVPVVLIVLGYAVLMHFTSFGRGIYAVGLSPEAATFSGIKVRRTKFILFVLSGLMAAIAGVYLTLQTSTARPENGQGTELEVIAAVVLGGVSVFGGKGSMHGVIAGVLLIGTIQSALRLAGITADVSQVIVGALLVISVVSPSMIARMDAMRLRRRRDREVPAATGRVPAA